MAKMVELMGNNAVNYAAHAANGDQAFKCHFSDTRVSN